MIPFVCNLITHDPGKLKKYFQQKYVYLACSSNYIRYSMCFRMNFPGKYFLLSVLFSTYCSYRFVRIVDCRTIIPTASKSVWQRLPNKFNKTVCNYALLSWILGVLHVPFGYPNYFCSGCIFITWDKMRKGRKAIVSPLGSVRRNKFII